MHNQDSMELNQIILEKTRLDRSASQEGNEKDGRCWQRDDTQSRKN